MNTSMFIKYFIPIVDDDVVLAILTFNDASTNNVVDRDDNMSLSQIEAISAVTDAGKSITNVNHVAIASECTTIEDYAFKNVTPNNWNPSNGVNFTSATNLQYINRSSFNSWTSATMSDNLQIPESIISMGQNDNTGDADRGVFSYWTSMTKGVEFGSNSQLKYIGFACFRDWTSANMTANLQIPKNVETIDNQCFEDWTSMTKGVEFQAGGTSALTLGSGLFAGWTLADMTSNLSLPQRLAVLNGGVFKTWSSMTKGVEFDSGTSITSIGDYCFAAWTNADMTTNLVIPNSVQIIDYQSFADWTSMTKGVTLGTGAQTLGNSCFRSWTNADPSADIVIPSSVQTIDNYAFRNWTGCTKGVNFSGSSLININDRCFENWTNADMASDLSIPVSVQFIEFGSFAMWSSMTKGINFNNNTTMTSIIKRSFSGWSSANMASDLVLPKNLTTIGDSSGFTPSYGAFSGWSSMTKGVDFNGTTTLATIGRFSFYQWSSANMTELVIPASVTTIDVGAFEGWSSMTGSLRFLSVTPPTLISSGSYYRQFYGWASSINVFVPVGANLSTWKSVLGVSSNVGSFASINGVPWASIP